MVLFESPIFFNNKNALRMSGACYSERLRVFRRTHPINLSMGRTVYLPTSFSIKIIPNVGTYAPYIGSAQFITTSAEVTPNGGLVMESPPKWP